MADNERDANHTAANRGDPADRKDATRTPTPGPDVEPDPTAGMDQEVGDLGDPDAVEDDGALPGRMGGGLAGG